MQDAESLALRKDWNADISAGYARGVAATRGGISSANEMRMPCAQRPAGFGLKGVRRELAIVPIAGDFDEIACGIEENDGAAAIGKDSGSKSERSGEHFLARKAALQKLAHFGQERGTLSPFFEGSHHFFILLVERLAGEIALPHLVLEAGIRVGQFLGAFLDLLLESLLVQFLFFDVGTGSEPLMDDAMLVA